VLIVTQFQPLVFGYTDGPGLKALYKPQLLYLRAYLLSIELLCPTVNY